MAVHVTLHAGSVLHLAQIYGPSALELVVSAAGLAVPGWRNPIPFDELRAVFWRTQERFSLAGQVEQLKDELASLAAARDEVERRATWYRRQLVLESRLGLAFAGLPD